MVSGRSSGVAVITFETPAEATRAKKQFDGILAKNQPMAIAYDTSPPPGARSARRSASAPSLLNRIEKPPLIERISRNDSKPQRNAASDRSVGPVRTKALRSGGRAARSKPKTAEDLDKELEAFMKDDITTGQAQPATATAATGTGEGDVEMA
ncbi:hypothetical protein BN946_scf184569.g29 [Trametes cinnabarina]|uniref:Chromatin target of PRMT1 protein C-terminal domain-containing protein n=1 Tax=Pycnoporus cinnabarinus TaxID=5643 RepID=A0A060S8C0_PYCCI|nr:hypothetical protein BN946_scf184569.g29 [Trametes cinnabarina]